MPVSWTKDAPTVYNFSGTDGNGGDYKMVLTAQGGGAFQATHQKEGANQGAISFDSLQTMKEAFAIVAANIP
jgi:hypothetical protein